MTGDLAVAHDHFYRWGGGEHLASELGRTFDAPVYTAFAHRQALKRTPEELDIRELIEGHPLEGVFRRHMQDAGWKRTLFYMFLWELAPELREYDTIVQSGNNPGWYVPDDDQTIVKYTHSTPRQAYDLFSERANRLDFAPWTHPGKTLSVVFDRGMKKATRQLWSPTTCYPTLYVANSDVVARRIRTYLGVPDERIAIVYPPVDVEQYEPAAGGDYYVALSRLSYHKNMDAIVRAFIELGADYPLRVVGDGPKADELRALADGHDHIECTGFVTNKRKRELLSGAAASVFAAKNEDFGIVPVESMAAGTPVIGVDDGFTAYQIRDGVNGLLFDEPGSARIASAVERFARDGVEWNADEIAAFADQFGRGRFDDEMRNVVDMAKSMHDREPAVRFDRQAVVE